MALLICCLIMTGCAAGRERVGEESLIPPDRGMLAVETMPSGARVYLNDALVGKSPQDKLYLKPGIYTLDVKKEGYQTWSEKIMILENTVHRIDASLRGSDGSSAGKVTPDTPSIGKAARERYY